jgi:hypothetical protein
MTKRRALTWIGWLAFAAAGVLCVTWVVAHARGPVGRLSQPDELILYSLAGYEHSPSLGGKAPEGELFHNVPILGKLNVENPQDRQEIVAALKDGAARGDKLAFCFFPRHGLRVTENGHTLDFVVCFECYQFKLFEDGREQTLPITRDPQEVFNKHLEAGGVSLAPGTVGAAK